MFKSEPRRDVVRSLQQNRPHELQQDVVRRQPREQRPQGHPEHGGVGGRVSRVDPRRLQQEEERALLDVGVLGERRQFGALLVEQEDLKPFLVRSNMLRACKPSNPVNAISHIAQTNLRTNLLSKLQEAVALSLARVPPGGDFDVSDVAVKVGRALVERRHELVQRVERELRGAAQRQADDVPLLAAEGGAAGEDDVPGKCFELPSAVLAFVGMRAVT